MVEKAWAHLPSQVTKITTIYRETIDEKDWNLAEIFYNKDIKKEPQ